MSGSSPAHAPDPETEAEALLRHGALYPIRLGLRPVGGEGPLVFAGFKHGAFSLYFGDEPSYHVDLEGRWQRCYVAPSHLLRRLDGSTQAIDRPRVGRNMVLDRRTLDADEAEALDESIRSMAADLADRVASGAFDLVAPPAPARAIEAEELRRMLGRMARWGRDAWAEHRRLYREAYDDGPPAFLPPDSPDAIVLRATRDGSPTPPEAFGLHCRTVAGLLGRGAVPLRTLFLDGPDVLRQPPEAVEAAVRVALDAFPAADGPAPARRSELRIDRPYRRGIHAVLGPGPGPVPGPDAWRRFRALGLSRVTLGLAAADGDESAPGAAITPRADLLPAVSGARSAGVAVSLVVWMAPTAAVPPEETAALVRSLGLGPGDHVYLVDARDPGGPAAGPGPSPADPIPKIEAALLAALAPLRRESGVKVLPYSVRKQGL